MNAIQRVVGRVALSITRLWHAAGRGRSAFFLALAVACTSPLVAAELPPSVAALPSETMLVARIPGGQAFLDALRSQTRLGKVVFGPERIQRISDYLGSEGTLPDELHQGLRRYNLKPADLAQVFQGELGFAGVALPRGDREPLFVGLSWLEPGEELADRLVKAVQSAVAETSDNEHPIRRIDLSLAGHDVMHLTFPQIDTEDVDTDVPDNVDEFTEEQLKRFFVEQARKQAEAKPMEVDQVHLFIARLDGRLLLANTFPQSASRTQAAGAGNVDLAAISGAEPATGVFARFLAAHDAPAAPPGSALLSQANLEGLLPGGTPLVEAVLDPRPLVKLAASNPLGPGLLTALGVDTLGPVGLRGVLDGNQLKYVFALSAPAPRSGVLALLDQQPLDPQPPDWVPASVTQFQQISFDLGKAYTQIRELVVRQIGDPARMQFDMVDAQVQNSLQADLATVLSSLGHQHTFLTFAPKPAPAAPAAGDIGAMFAATFTERVGMVWQVRDEQLWRRLIKLIADFAPLTQGAVLPAEEQGFTGVRVQGPIEGGLFVANATLVLGIGSEVTESLLATLRNPPGGTAALGNSELFRRAQALLALRPCFEYNLTDAKGEPKKLKDLVLSFFEAQVNLLDEYGVDDEDEAGEDGGQAALAAQKARLERIRELLPTDDELEGLMGVGVGMTTVDGRGMVSHSVLELPAP
ncbi:MAG: hypothetical protein WD847_10540 [Pirellulales bacterium]